MKQLVDKVKAAFEALTIDELFKQPQSARHRIRYFTGDIPAKRTDPSNEEDVPFCIVNPIKISLIEKSYTVRAVFMLFNECYQEAQEDLDRLEQKINQIQFHAFDTHRLREIEIVYGDYEGQYPSGMQSDPLYRLLIDMEFTRFKRQTRC